jgi:arylsulfatase A-like enzyme
MIADLEQHRMLEKTLIVINTEFGRPAQFDSGGGRGHHSKNFCMVMAGGGLRHRGAYGVSDELAMKAVENPVSVPDAFATILATLGIDPSKNLYDGDRPVPITDGGKPIDALL